MALSPKVEYAGWGAVGGAVVLAVVGFGFGGWHTGGKTKELVYQASQAAVSKALTPVCVASFNALATPAQWAEFQAKESYSRGEIVKAVVKIPGQDSLDYTLAGNCASAITVPSAKSAAK